MYNESIVHNNYYAKASIACSNLIWNIQVLCGKLNAELVAECLNARHIFMQTHSFQSLEETGGGY